MDKPLRWTLSLSLPVQLPIPGLCPCRCHYPQAEVRGECATCGDLRPGVPDASGLWRCTLCSPVVDAPPEIP